MPIDAFLTRAEAAFDALFADARTKSEIDFVLALNPEFRGIQDAGWSPAEEVLRAIEDFSGFLNDGGVTIRLRVRAALGFYCNLCEASGLYEVPKNLMRIPDGQKHHCWPFQDLVEQHTRTGEAILPNANKIMKNLVGHSKALGHGELAGVLSEAFDAELRHAFAHADYVIWADGVRICGKHFTKKRVIPFPEFQALVNRGAGFITTLRSVMARYVRHYATLRVIDGSISRVPGDKALVSYNTDTGVFRIESYDPTRKG